MFKKIMTFFMALLVVMQPMVATATDLDAAFGNLLGPGAVASVNKPGAYQSGARNSFVAGGMEMRVPRTSGMPQLFSVTPPRISAGCNGISATFGGFSFISGAEFEQSLKSIASGAALGFVSMMVMKTMCPPCEAVVQYLKSAAQMAARLSKDSCQWGQDMAQKFMEGNSTQTNTKEVCGATVSDNGTASDYLAATKDACNSVTSAVKAILDANPNAATNPDTKAALLCAVGAGNNTWQRLAAFDSEGANSSATATSSDGYRRKLLLLNLLGAELGLAEDGSKAAYCHTDDGQEEKPDEVTKTVWCKPRLNPQDAMGLFMCGDRSTVAASANDSQRVADYCKSFYENATSSSTTGGSLSVIKNTKVYYCKDGAATCNQMELTDAGVIVQGKGFLPHVNELLRLGVKAVRDDTPMPNDVIRLMQVAPYPLYQAINAAAVYPTAADDLVDSMSILVAEQVAVAYLDDVLRMSGRKTAKGKSCVSPKQATQILDTVASIRAGNKARLMQLAQNISVQEALSEQIRQVNLAIQKQVMSQDMLATGGYAQAVTKALSPNVAAGITGTAPAPAAPTTPAATPVTP